MKPLIRLHGLKLGGLLLLANLGLLFHLGAGDLKPTASWDWRDIVGEGGSALLAFSWCLLLLKGRPDGRVTRLLFCGLSCLFLSLWMDAVDEFVDLPDSVGWDQWMESGPMPLGLILITLGVYHWHSEQLAINAQMEKRERVFREHRLFDAVTPLGGADYLRAQLGIALQQSRSDQQPLSLLMLDLDDFQQINRTWGHAEGDRLLQTVTQLLLLNLRRQDLLCRLAGDRFVALLPNTGKRQAQQMADELRMAVGSCAYRSSGQGERIELSAGAAAIMAREESATQLLERLNLALARSRPPLVRSA